MKDLGQTLVKSVAGIVLAAVTLTFDKGTLFVPDEELNKQAMTPMEGIGEAYGSVMSKTAKVLMNSEG